MTATYATVLDLANYLAIAGKIPDLNIVASDRVKEEVGTGDNIQTRFFFDNAFVIPGTYIISSGSAEPNSGTALVETTEFTVNPAEGRINLTAAGVTAVGTDKIFAIYDYITLGLTHAQLQEALDRAQAEIDKLTGNHFSDGGTTTPDYTQVTDEKHDGLGKFERDYYLDKYPLPNFSTALGSATIGSAETAFVNSTDGFPNSGIFLIGNNKVSYTAKSGTAFTGCIGLTAHDNEKAVYPFSIEISSTDSGTNPTFTVLENISEFDIDLDTGRVKIAVSDRLTNLLSLGWPQRLTANRFRANYLHGEKELPLEINRLCLMIATKDLLHTAVRKAHLLGKNDFDPALINIDEDWIKSTIEKYNSWKVKNI